MSNSTPDKDILNGAHREILKARGIPAEFALRHGIRSLDLAAVAANDDTRKIKSFPGTQMPPVGAMLIPYPDTLDHVQRWRLRVDSTSYSIPGPEGTHQADEIGQCPRYLCQAGVSVAPYITDEVMRVAGDTSVDLYLVEAPLKALCLTHRGLLAIGLGGVLAGTHDRDVLKEIGELLAHPEIARFEWRGRRAFIVFDAGISSNPLVALGAARLWKVLSDLGADVRIVYLPYFHPQDSQPEEGVIWGAHDQGPDDYLARLPSMEIGPLEAFQRCREDSGDPLVRFQGIAGLPPADRAREAGRLLRDLYCVAALSVAGEPTLAGIVALKCGLTKSGLKAAINEFQDRLAVRAAVEEPAWTQGFRRSSTGALRPIRENVELALLSDPNLKLVLGFDVFSNTMMKLQSPPWAGGTGPWTDLDDLRLATYLADTYELVDIHPPKIRAAVIGVSHRREYHPVQDYLNGLSWDGTERVNGWLQSYMGVEPGEVATAEYVTNVGRWWLISAVARAMVPGAKVDHTLILEGDQGAAKSSSLEVLGGEWASDADLGDLRSKESALVMQGCWILELAEGEIFDRASTKTLKKYATKRRDDIVLKFSNLKTRMERQVVFCLTCNEFEFVDKTGNRRFWPVRGDIDLAALTADRDQLWAEAVTMYRAELAWWPVIEQEKQLCRNVQAVHEAEHSWLASIASAVQSLDTTSVSQVLDLLDVPVRQRKKAESCAVTECLRELGWVETNSRKNGVRQYRRGEKAGPKAESGLRVIEGGLSQEEMDELLGGV